MSSPLPDRRLAGLFREQRERDAREAPTFERLARGARSGVRGDGRWKVLAWAAAVVVVTGLLAMVAGRAMGPGQGLVASSNEWPEVELVLPEAVLEEDVLEWESPTEELLVLFTVEVEGDLVLESWRL